jgi:hypothetical protein
LGFIRAGGLDQHGDADKGVGAQHDGKESRYNDDAPELGAGLARAAKVAAAFARRSVGKRAH